MDWTRRKFVGQVCERFFQAITFGLHVCKVADVDAVRLVESAADLTHRFPSRQATEPS
ncbi:hypothetical protein BXY51_009109 [Actinoplanes cyaneus]|nr:hypothetical protein [Actinoplanes cyaneus]